MTLSDSQKKILEQFLDNGLDVSQFRFKDDIDKQHFFTMYDDYMQIFASQTDDVEVLVQPTPDHDVNVFVNNKEVCYIYFNEDLTTIKMETFESIENTVLVYCIKVLMGTVKELAEIVSTFASMMTKLADEARSQDEESKLSEQLAKSLKDKRRKGTYKNVPEKVFNSINKIQKIQKSILDDVDKYKVTIPTKDKEKE